jgi:hypothetical protein
VYLIKHWEYCKNRPREAGLPVLYVLAVAGIVYSLFGWGELPSGKADTPWRARRV